MVEIANEKKDKYSLLPADGLRAMAAIMTLGLERHEADAWKKRSATEFYDAAMRHLNAWACGEKNNPHTKMHHFYHVAVNAVLGACVDRQKQPAEYEVACPTVPSIFSVHDGDALCGRWYVPGTLAEVHVDGRGVLSVHVAGHKNSWLSEQVLREFAYQPMTASTMCAIGHFVQKRYA